MLTIKTFPHVLLYDKNNKDFHCTNRPDEIESLFNGAPVVIKTDKGDKFIGTTLFASNRSKTSLYYGDIVLKDEYDDWDKLNVIDTRGIPTSEGSHKLKFIVIYVEKAD